jgi:prepilin-type N-terminal cleavage/methylation domain-containing protein
MRGARGFSLIEVLTVIGIIAVLSTLAIPSYISWVFNRRLQSAASEVQSVIQLAKTAAIKQNVNVVIAFDPDARSYSAFVDDGGGGAGANNRIRDNGERVIRSGIFQSDIGLTTSFAGHQLLLDGRGFSNAVSPGVTLTHPTQGTRIVAVGITGSSQVR